MQINYKIPKVVSWGVRLFVLLASGYYIVDSIGEEWRFDLKWSTRQWMVVFIVFLLSFLNWGLESFRWKFSLKQIQPVSYQNAMVQVLTGLTMNWIIPFTGGDLISRILPNIDRGKVALLIYWNRTLMLGLTIVFGLWGIYWFSKNLFVSNWWIAFIGFFGIGFTGYGIKKIFQNPLGFESYFLLKLLGISSLRYATFTIQFFLLIAVFNPVIPKIKILAGVGYVFFFRSILPSLFGNLGIREASTLAFFSDLVSDPILIILPSFLIWCINIVIPSMIGLLFMIRNPIKIFK